MHASFHGCSKMTCQMTYSCSRKWSTKCRRMPAENCIDSKSEAVLVLKIF